MSMVEPARKPPRFVPTLTEVVPSVAAVETMDPGTPRLPQALNEQALVDRVMQKVQLSLDARLREVLAEWILSRSPELAGRVNGELERIVRDAVRETLTAGTPPPG